MGFKFFYKDHPVAKATSPGELIISLSGWRDKSVTYKNGEAKLIRKKPCGIHKATIMNNREREQSCSPDYRHASDSGNMRFSAKPLYAAQRGERRHVTYASIVRQTQKKGGRGRRKSSNCCYSLLLVAISNLFGSGSIPPLGPSEYRIGPLSEDELRLCLSLTRAATRGICDLTIDVHPSSEQTACDRTITSIRRGPKPKCPRKQKGRNFAPTSTTKGCVGLKFLSFSEARTRRNRQNLV